MGPKFKAEGAAGRLGSPHARVGRCVPGVSQMKPLVSGPVGLFAVAGVGLIKEQQAGAVPALGTPRRCGDHSARRQRQRKQLPLAGHSPYARFSPGSRVGIFSLHFPVEGMKT